MEDAFDDDLFASNQSIRRIGSGRSAMDQIFDRSRHSIGFDGGSLLDMSNGAGNFASSTTSISFSSSNNGQPTYVKTVSSKSMRDGQGNVVSESKGHEKDSNGMDKRAFQRRVNDQYHMRAKHRQRADEEWKTEQRLVNIRMKSMRSSDSTIGSIERRVPRWNIIRENRTRRVLWEV